MFIRVYDDYTFVADSCTLQPAFAGTGTHCPLLLPWPLAARLGCAVVDHAGRSRPPAGCTPV